MSQFQKHDIFPWSTKAGEDIEVETITHFNVYGKYVPARIHPVDLSHPAEYPEAEIEKVGIVKDEWTKTLTEEELKEIEEAVYERYEDDWELLEFAEEESEPDYWED